MIKQNPHQMRLHLMWISPVCIMNNDIRHIINNMLQAISLEVLI